MTDDIMLMGKNPNFLGSWDLYDMPNGQITVTLKKIQDEEVINAGQKQGCTVAHFEENIKPMILNLTNKKTLAKLYKTKSTKKLIGKKITIGYEKVKAFGAIHDALRIKKEIPDDSLICADCGKPIASAHGMSSAQVAAYTLKSYGVQVCAECGAKRKQAKEQ